MRPNGGGERRSVQGAKRNHLARTGGGGVPPHTVANRRDAILDRGGEMSLQDKSLRRDRREPSRCSGNYRARNQEIAK